MDLLKYVSKPHNLDIPVSSSFSVRGIFAEITEREKSKNQERESCYGENVIEIQNTQWSSAIYTKLDDGSN
jgi:hypothetical protein